MWARPLAAGVPSTRQGRCDTQSFSHIASSAPGRAAGASSISKRAASARQASAAAAAQASQT
eukprot:10946746-Alexandrium_andersonii.AAC.1